LLVIGYSYAHGSLSATLPFLDLIYSAQFVVLSALGLVACGILFGVVGSLLGTRHYLKLV